MPRTFDAMARALRGNTLLRRWHHTAVCMASPPSVGGSLPLYTIPRARPGAPGAPLAQHPLLQMPNALCTPHLAYAERGSYESLYTVAVDQLLAFVEGKSTNVTNLEAVGKR